MYYGRKVFSMTSNNADYSVSSDLYTDWINELRKSLESEGNTIPPNASKLDICSMYFNLQKRKITEKPRQVFIAKSFTCPPEHQNGLRALRSKMEAGEDLTPHLSEKLRKLKYNDMMLNDWGIYHFHLGTELRNNGYVKRTGPVLYARVTQDSIFFINVENHGSWTNQQLMEVVHRNWPTSLENYKLDFSINYEITGNTREEIWECRKKFRELGVSAPLEMADGTVYMSPGGGYMMSGVSTEVVMTHDQNAYHMRCFEKSLHDNIAKLAKKIHELTEYQDNDFIFKLELSEGILFAVESNSGSMLELFPMKNFVS